MNTLIIFCAKYLIFVEAALFIYFFFQTPIETRRRILGYIVLVSIISLMIAVGVSHLYENPRPFVVDNFTPLVIHTPDNGFPSDHALLAFALASIAIFSYKRKAASVLWLIAVCVALGRVAAGVHHFLDILASLVITLLCAILVHIIISKISYGTKPKQ